MDRMITAAAMICLGGVALADVAGSGDHPLIPRYPGSEIIKQSTTDYDEYKMATSPRSGGKVESQRLEGKLTRTKYRLTPTDRSDLEVLRNYRKALADAGFEEIFSCGTEDECGSGFFYQIIYKINRMSIENKSGSRYLTAKLKRPEGDMTVALAVQQFKLPSTGSPTIDVALDVIEAEEMDVGMELKLAEELGREIDTDGRAALYGILFEHDSAKLTPESSAEIEQVAMLLSSKPELKLLVVGHTDNQGGLDYNIDLSKRRAAAVVSALVSNHGVSAKRLSPHGVGYLSPVASNETESGRAENRRVELVKN
jgi:outer membrane protein OmpA-like peptidoglycan-associated protein